MLCVTGVYLRDVTNTTFSILHLNVNYLSICSACGQVVVGVDRWMSE